ncbi:MAG: hypothetical protein R3B72_48100 [Polyangiaceae bacterium]
MKYSAWILLVALAASTTACSSSFRGSAPAQTANARYVVGAQQGFFGADPTIWLCPENAGEEAECQEVEIVE